MRVAVLGAGPWGTALAALLDEIGHEVALWEFDRAAAARLARERTHAYLGIAIDARIAVTDNLAAAARGCEMVVVATPSAAVRSACAGAAPALAAGAIIVCAAKGLEAGTGASMPDVIAGAAPGVPCALVSGPTFAKEIAAGLPAAVVVAAREAAVATAVQRALGCERLRVYTTDDVIGVAIGGALKNVVAIAVGVSDGLGLGGNARAALITRGISEMGRLALRLGGQLLTLAGLAGLGDLVLTCTGDLSRNRQVGLGLARGEALGDIVRRLGQVAEGVETARTAATLARALGVELPIIERVAAVLHDGQAPAQAVAELLARDVRPERD